MSALRKDVSRKSVVQRRSRFAWDCEDGPRRLAGISQALGKFAARLEDFWRDIVLNNVEAQTVAGSHHHDGAHQHASVIANRHRDRADLLGKLLLLDRLTCRADFFCLRGKRFSINDGFAGVAFETVAGHPAQLPVRIEHQIDLPGSGAVRG